MIALRHTGDYDLDLSVRSAGRAVFVDPPAADGLELAFALDESWAPVAVRIEQLEPFGPVQATVLANPRRAHHDTIRDQLERILSLDPDGRGLARVAERDAVAAALIGRFRGLRPIAYSTPYEAAARTIIGHRLAIPAAAAIFRRLAEDHGTRLDADRHAFPAPERLAELRSARGLPDRKRDQLRALGAAGATGDLSTRKLLAMDRGDAMKRLQRLPGIGPFSAELILIRGCGDPDVFPRTEGRLHRAMTEAYHLGEDPDLNTLEAAAADWHPYRSWIGLMARDLTRDRTTGSVAA